ncbi:CHAT domain-containing protein [Flagelloscypha sp. PMI_526]|nr:CHAT domain-containing protein [Flagelloscypha sp. PMI_526]
MLLNNLGTSHARRFEYRGETADIEKAIESLLHAVELTPHNHPDKPLCLTNLGNSQLTRFERLGTMDDIDKAIEYYLMAVNLTAHSHPNKPVYLNNLGNSHRIRFSQLGEMSDISKFMEYQSSAVELTTDEHPNKPIYLSNLGASHAERFERLGTIADIDKAIESQLKGVDLTPNGHPNKPIYLNNLGTSYAKRFEHLGDMADINKFIESLLRAIELTPNGHPHKPMYFDNLGNSRRLRYEHHGQTVDIDKAIESQLIAVGLTTNKHPNKPMYLNNLGLSHWRRFERLGELPDIDKAIGFQHSAVELTADGHPNKPGFLSNLGNSHRARFQHLGELYNIDKAIECQVRALQLTPNGHPDRPGRLGDLGNSHMKRYERLEKISDIKEAINNFEQCALSMTGRPVTRFKAARAWISALQLKNKISLLTSPGLLPQHTLMNLIPELVWLGAPVDQRFQTIQDVVGPSFHEAVSAAIRAQELELAVEWMEQGRSIVWSQLRQLRSPVLDLQAAHPLLAQEFQEVQRSIEMSFLRHDITNQANTPVDSLEQQAQAHRRNTQRREDLLTKIRAEPGFESFLRPQKFSALSKACEGCLVVLLTASEGDCDALIISPSGSITHLSFPNVSQDDMSDLLTQWESSRLTRLENRGDESPAAIGNRGEGPAILDVNPMTTLLSDLWEKIVHPIVKKTELWHSAIGRLNRIIWCPSGPLTFLPLHAAGVYHSDTAARTGISDFAVSSYIPSLMALQSKPLQLGRPSILMITQPNTPNQKPLPGTVHEAKKIIQKAALNDMEAYVHHISNTQATVSAVTEELEKHGWVHLACHGTQKFPDPMESSFALHDGSLTLATLTQKSMGHSQFGFLSACQTATGDRALPDEAMHLTSGMLAAGFPSVVGTMWSIGDSIAPEVAEAFYGTLFEEGYKSDWKVKPEPAYALHAALKKLRDETTGDHDLMKWVPFVHFGI